MFHIRTSHLVSQNKDIVICMNSRPLTSVDTNVTVGIEISGMENLESVSSIEIISESGRDVNIYSVREQGAGRHHNFFRQEISVPRQVGHNL